MPLYINQFLVVLHLLLHLGRRNNVPWISFMLFQLYFHFLPQSFWERKEEERKRRKLRQERQQYKFLLPLDLHKIIVSNPWRELEMSSFCQQHLYTQAHTIKPLLVCALLMKTSSLTLLPWHFHVNLEKTYFFEPCCLKGCGNSVDALLREFQEVSWKEQR